MPMQSLASARDLIRGMGFALQCAFVCRHGQHMLDAHQEVVLSQVLMIIHDHCR